MNAPALEQSTAVTPAPQHLVCNYLNAMEARDLDRAATFLRAGFEMVFPGAVRMRSLPELVNWAKPRYRHVRKRYEGTDVATTPLGAVVHCRGTLSGQWPDGTPFDGIRFIDRFEIENGKIIRQEVWNDLGEVRQ